MREFVMLSNVGLTLERVKCSRGWQIGIVSLKVCHLINEFKNIIIHLLGNYRFVRNFETGKRCDF